MLITLGIILSLFCNNTITLVDDYGRNSSLLFNTHNLVPLQLSICNRTEKEIAYDPNLYDIEKYNNENGKWEKYFYISETRLEMRIIKRKSQSYFIIGIPQSKKGYYRVRKPIDILDENKNTVQIACLYYYFALLS